MDILIFVVIALICLAAGFFAGKAFISNATNTKVKEARAEIEQASRAAETIKREANIEAKDAAIQIKQQAEAEAKELKSELKVQTERLASREQSCDRRVESLDKREHQLSSLQGQLTKDEASLKEKLAQAEQRLLKISGLSVDEAKQIVINNVKEECQHESAAIIRESKTKTKAEANRNAREILSVAIQRMSADISAEHTITSVEIPSDDIKGRIIGREGRNIRTFEQITGANLIIDDTPETVVVSCFDPVRREIARLTLENLIADGRIHPARIEKLFKKAASFVEQKIHEAGETAAFDMGIHDFDDELIKILGRLKYRTSYGQNVLQHSLEVANIACTIASELGVDTASAKRAGLLHDLGKAIDHEVEGSHAALGAELARRYHESDEIVHAIEAHHNEVEPKTVLAVIIQAADAVSAARPGARRESYEGYVKRLEQLEQIANAHKGVEKTYAMQAGREIRVMVQPDTVDDDSATVLAHDIASEIEKDMEYPGQVHVVVIRQTRAESIAK